MVQKKLCWLLMLLMLVGLCAACGQEGTPAGSSAKPAESSVPGDDGAFAVTEAVKLLIEQGERIAEMENNDIHLIKQRMVHEPGAGILHQALFEWCGKKLWLSLPIPKEGQPIETRRWENPDSSD